ncbi:MAG: hypothetical protein D6689_17930 [Deltaproteobacteria bacterium]|nr:MAG: hypothetical protein D6689_17930 [Deltaproteobacteria bacterium]
MKPETRELLAYLDRVEPVLRELSFFELLDVSPDATGDEIQAAYHAVAARMHPDRHRAELTAAQYERLNIVYGRIAEAYRVLRDPRERDRYTRELASRADAAGAGEAEAVWLLSPKAQAHYRRAQAALRTGDRASAILHMKMALRASPGSALLRAALADLERRG